MSNLRNSRFARLLNKAFVKLAKVGIVPSYQRVLDALKGILRREKSGALLEPASIKDGQQFPLAEFNKNLDEVKFDLDLLYDEGLFLGSTIVENDVIREERVGELRHQLRKTRESLEKELLLSGSNFLDAIVIRFIDRDKINLEGTTASVDINSGNVTLPTRAGSKRVVPASRIAGPSEVETEGMDGRVLPGSVFNNIFSDNLNSWHIKTSGRFLRVRWDLGSTINFSRVEIGMPNDGATVELRLSSDGINFIKATPPKTIVGGHVSFLFESKDTRYVELYIEQDGVGERVLTIDSFAMYSEGYQSEATLLTNVLEPVDGGLIKVAAIDLDADIPDGTEVSIEASTDGTEWIPVKNKTLDFTKSIEARKDFIVTTPKLYSYSTVLGLRGFTAGAVPNTSISINDVWGVLQNPDVFGGAPPSNIDSKSLLLFRTDNWGFRSNRKTETVSHINAMEFDLGERRALYRQIIGESHKNTGSATAVLTLERDVITGNNLAQTGIKDAQVISITGTLGIPVEKTVNIVVADTGAERTIRVDSTSGAWTALINQFDTISIYSSGTTSRGITDAKIQSIDSGLVSIYLDPATDLSIFNGTLTNLTARIQTRDLTDNISSIAGNVITLDNDIQAEETVVISYCTPLLLGHEDVIESSVVVRSALDSSLIATPETDYRIRDNQIEILNTSSFGSTTIPVTIQFQYTITETQLANYWVYANVPNGPSRSIRLQTPLNITTDERVIWTDPSGRSIDLNGVSNLNLAPGVHTFNVFSRLAVRESTASSIEVDVDSAMYKVLNLKSVDGGFLFIAGNQFFESLTGFPEPLTPTGRFFLERQANSNDKEHFALADSGLLTVLKLDNPGDTLRLKPNSTSISTGSSYRLQYRYANSSGVSGVYLRLLLKRDPGASNDRTPVVKGLIIRFTE